MDEMKTMWVFVGGVCALWEGMNGELFAWSNSIEARIRLDSASAKIHSLRHILCTNALPRQDAFVPQISQLAYHSARDNNGAKRLPGRYLLVPVLRELS
jgi:hypothetical protein